MDARRRARIGGQLLGGGKPRDLPHFEGDHDGERESSRWIAGLGLNAAWYTFLPDQVLKTISWEFMQDFGV